MNPPKSEMAQILKLCLEIDGKAYNLFAKFAKECAELALSKDFQKMADEEKSHVKFWKKCLELVESGELPEFIDNSDKLLSRIEEIKKNVLIRIKANEQQILSTEKMLEAAYHIESFMLDKDMMQLFDFFSFVEPDIETQYDTHVGRMINMLRLYGQKSSGTHFDLLAGALNSLWNTTRKALKEGISDPLTGLLNRRGFFRLVKPIAAFAARRKIPSGIIMCDIDDFKKINDTHGHPAGDAAIRMVSKLIRKHTRSSDICGRYGGEEFVVFMLSETSSAFFDTAERIRAKIFAESESICGFRASASFGIAFKVLEFGDEKELEALISLADQNLLEAKRKGKNRTCDKIKFHE